MTDGISDHGHTATVDHGTPSVPMCPNGCGTETVWRILVVGQGPAYCSMKCFHEHRGETYPPVDPPVVKREPRPARAEKPRQWSFGDGN